MNDQRRPTDRRKAKKDKKADPVFAIDVPGLGLGSLPPSDGSPGEEAGAEPPAVMSQAENDGIRTPDKSEGNQGSFNDGPALLLAYKGGNVGAAPDGGDNWNIDTGPRDGSVSLPSDIVTGVADYSDQVTIAKYSDSGDNQSSSNDGPAPLSADIAGNVGAAPDEGSGNWNVDANLNKYGSQWFGGISDGPVSIPPTIDTQWIDGSGMNHVDFSEQPPVELQPIAQGSDQAPSAGPRNEQQTPNSADKVQAPTKSSDGDGKWPQPPGGDKATAPTPDEPRTIAKGSDQAPSAGPRNEQQPPASGDRIQAPDKSSYGDGKWPSQDDVKRNLDRAERYLAMIQGPFGIAARALGKAVGDAAGTYVKDEDAGAQKAGQLVDDAIMSNIPGVGTAMAVVGGTNEVKESVQDAQIASAAGDKLGAAGHYVDAALAGLETLTVVVGDVTAHAHAPPGKIYAKVVDKRAPKFRPTRAPAARPPVPPPPPMPPEPKNGGKPQADAHAGNGDRTVVATKLPDISGTKFEIVDGALVGTGTREQFRQDVATIIARSKEGEPDAKLKFLLGPDKKLFPTTERGMTHAVLWDNPQLIEAGHTLSEHAGGDRLIIQDAWTNRGRDAATVEHSRRGGHVEHGSALQIGSFAVDHDTAKAWHMRGLITSEQYNSARRIQLK